MIQNSPIQHQLTTWLLRKTAISGVRRVASLSAAIATDIGNVRHENQDRAAIGRGIDRDGKEYAVVAVADGIGGMRDGATCAAMTLGAFLAALHHHAESGTDNPDDWMRGALKVANNAVFTKYAGDGGSTLTAVLIRPGFPAYWLSVGDSRVYLVSGKHINQVSVDDTIAGQLGKTHDVSLDQSTLLQFVGMGDELEPHIGEIRAESGVAAVLTTDGVHYLASASGWLGTIISNSPDPGSCVKRLVELSKWCGGHDNATVATITLSSDQGLENSHYPNLTLWDAFGELQILTSKAVEDAKTSSRGDSRLADPQPALGICTPMPEKNQQASVQPHDHKEVLSKPRRDKKTNSKNPQQRRRRKRDKNTEPEPPQLSVEFPEKPK